MASFTGVGDNVELFVANRGEVIDIDISGTYDMTIEFQVELGSKGSGVWQTVKTFDTANATVADQYTTRAFNENLRLIVTVDTSGTATATLTDNDNRSQHDFKDDVGTQLFELKDKGAVFYGSMQYGNSAGVVNLTANTTLTADDHAGVTVVFNDADGATLTLPAATGTGNVYRFVVGVTVTSNNDIIQVANATDEFVGVVLQVDTDTSDTLAAYPALDGDGFDTITLDGSTKGGLMGDYIQLVDVASGKWQLTGFVNATGSPASPLSAAVS